jgi:hypothetical protein
MLSETGDGIFISFYLGLTIIITVTAVFVWIFFGIFCKKRHIPAFSLVVFVGREASISVHCVAWVLIPIVDKICRYA